MGGPCLFEQAERYLMPVLGRRRLFVVADATVARTQWPRLEPALRRGGIEAPLILFDGGEENKNWAALGRLLERILDLRPERADAVLALGGGVVGDVAGLAASLVLRGIDYIQAPTTLLAQVDSAVGGKTGVNTRHGKNLVGAFHQPRLVLADLDALATLPRRELLAGYAEIVKYGLIDDPEFFAWLEVNGERMIAGDAALRQVAVVWSCRAKARIVAADERESGARALLNFGHTFGHALEAAAGFGEALKHGEAVAIGMPLAFELSARLGLCAPADAERVRRHLAAVGLPTAVPAGANWTASGLTDYIAQDKKIRDGRATFVLARGIGRAYLEREVDPAAVRSLLEHAIAA